MRRILLAGTAVVFIFVGNAQAAPVLITTDFIPSPAHFNGFENIPNDGTFYSGGAGPYTEDGITVEQINGQPPPDIWVTVGGTEGNYAWYLNGGDFGYTRITYAGDDIADISLIFRAYDVGNVRYVVRNNGVTLLDGFLASPNGALGRIGFTGGGFDEVLLRTGLIGSPFFNGVFQALQIDSIDLNQAAIPEPATLLLLGAGLGALRLRRRSRG